MNDLPAGYRWATAEETETYGAFPQMYPEMIVVPRTADASGTPYTQGEADLALPDTRERCRFGCDPDQWPPAWRAEDGTLYCAGHQYVPGGQLTRVARGA